MKGYAGSRKIHRRAQGCRLDMEEQDGITLIERIATNNNLWIGYT